MKVLIKIIELKVLPYFCYRSSSCLLSKYFQLCFVSAYLNNQCKINTFLLKDIFQT